jgi:peptidoglycan-associated lipoprotein
VAAPSSARPDDEYGRIRGADLDTINRMGLLIDVHFEFNRADIRDVDRSILTRDAEILRKFDFLRVTVEGHCDERGTVEYNLALGERRAAATRDYLVSLGVAADRLRTASYGKEAPACYEHGEDCWARNRRAHLTVSGKNPR